MSLRSARSLYQIRSVICVVLLIVRQTIDTCNHPGTRAKSCNRGRLGNIKASAEKRRAVLVSTAPHGSKTPRHSTPPPHRGGGPRRDRTFDKRRSGWQRLITPTSPPITFRH